MRSYRPAYMKNIGPEFAGIVKVKACCDLDASLAKGLAETYSIPNIFTLDQMLADPEIQIIVNLTPAPAHYSTSKQIIAGGKHLFSEKPLALEFGEAKELVALAESNGVQIAGAPDTFLGAGFEEVKRQIAKGAIGDPIAATAIVTLPMFNVKRYHYVFNGAVLDLCPYYITALVQLFGSVKTVTGLAEMQFPDRVDSTTGEPFTPPRPSTAGAVLSFENACIATLLASHDADAYYPSVEVLGTKGRMTIPDSNQYPGFITLRKGYKEETRIDVDESMGFAKLERGLGVAEFAHAIINSRESRTPASLMLHVLEVQHAILQSADQNHHISISSSAKISSSIPKQELESYRA